MSDANCLDPIQLNSQPEKTGSVLLILMSDLSWVLDVEDAATLIFSSGF